MARTSLPITNLTANSAVTNLTNAGANMTAVDNVNGMTISFPTTNIPASGSGERLVLLVLNTNATGQTVTVRASTKDGGASKLGAGTQGPPFTPGFQGGKGDMVTTAMTATTGIGIIGPFDPARFVQPDGTISVDFSGATGFITALMLQRAF
jgi:hypothetical protein